jgi:ABC-type branched-subunit amino acid transport system ATPase component
MLVQAITIKKFKAIDQVRLDLKTINVLAGGNNAGKSCALQAIHVAVALAQTAKAEGAANFAPEKLRYVPTDLFTDLKFREQLSERGDPVVITFEVEDAGVVQSFDVPLRRGRNSTISTVSPDSLAAGLGAHLASADRPFSVYVPGLAGIPSRETYQGRLVVDRGAVRGDANLYLRNVLHRLFRDPVKKAKFQSRVAALFDGLEIFAEEFDENRHEHIPVYYRRGGVKRPLDMVGTGTLQAIQILGYASFYQPVLLLLDEPDAHLHPNNQLKLVEALSLLAEEENLQIVLATHSRHLLQAVHGASDVSSFHLRAGVLAGTDPELSELLVDLGAIDKYDTLSLREKNYLILGEDKLAESDPNHPLRQLLRTEGLADAEMLVMSFQGCTEIRSVALLATFVAAHHSAVQIIVHRDSDFLSEDEIASLVIPQFKNLANVQVFVTDGSDLEAAFLLPEHVSMVCGIDGALAEEIIEEVALSNHNSIVTRFNDKRAALHKMYGRRDPPLARTEDVRSAAIPLPPAQRVGKDMVRWVERKLKDLGHLQENATLITPSVGLHSEKLRQIIEDLRP